MSAGGRIYGIGPATVARAEEAGLAFAKSMGIAETRADALAALRALPADKVNGDLSMEALITKPASYAVGRSPIGNCDFSGYARRGAAQGHGSQGAGVDRNHER
ncbi:MAG: hypothetical protein GEV06_23570 [Luteitalea sp.]|nr:hypothetical protein [Luteitalea sp.]